MSERLQETLCVCRGCGQSVPWDEFSDFENDLCDLCSEADYQAQHDYWKPLYEGEKLAGLLPRNHYKD